jgi:hypothetical protein
MQERPGPVTRNGIFKKKCKKMKRRCIDCQKKEIKKTNK